MMFAQLLSFMPTCSSFSSSSFCLPNFGRSADAIAPEAEATTVLQFAVIERTMINSMIAMF